MTCCCAKFFRFQVCSHVNVLVTLLRKAWEIAWNEVELHEELGRGAFGRVYAATWREMRIAVKTVASLKGGNDSDASGGGLDTNPFSAELDKEISMLQLVRHPNIVLFFGAGTTSDGMPFLATELMELGPLTQYLADHPKLSWQQKVSFALDTALGMAHVHSLGRMHRDLKSGNLLISAALRVKVADFGTATIAGLTIEALQDTSMESSLDQRLHTQRTKGVGTPLWMAPELLSGKSNYGPSADVYSFGIVMWEIAAQSLPWADLPDCSFFMRQLLQEILAEKRPPLQASWPASYRNLISRCWATNPSARTTFKNAVIELESMPVLL